MTKFKNILKLFLTYRIFLFVNFLILILKFCYSYFILGFVGNTFEDWSIAQNIANYGVYSEHINLGSTAYKLPIYPLFLSLFIKVFGEFALTAIISAQHCIFFVIPLLFIHISRIFKMEKIGLITAYAFILSPAYFQYSNVIEATNLFLLIFILFLSYFAKIWNGHNDFKTVVVFSVYASLLFLTQVVAVPLGIILILSLCYFHKINFSNLLMVFGLVGVLYSPWIIRNHLVFDKLIISKTPIWQNIYMGFVEDYQIFKSLQQIPHEEDYKVFQMRKHVDEFKMEEFYRNKVKEIITENPGIEIRKSFSNALLLWYVPARYFYDNSLPIVFGRKIYVIVLNVFTIVGLIVIWNQGRHKLFWFSILLFTNFTLPYMIGHAANTRFKLDFEFYQLFIVSYLIFFFAKMKITRL